MSRAEFLTSADHSAAFGTAQKPSQSSIAATASTACVRALNDAFRRSFAGGQVVETPGVIELAEIDRIALLLAVRRFSSFDPDNDPHGEHDFGAVEVGGERFFWKIDAYDRALLGGSPDPTDPAVTTRVLTIMCADEY
ncbi:DUF3768 domain-containing protein [Methylobacterium mesophilicum SR1.6/6]|uniref:DUF3768 domain-containing protein n=1 Tax=Methylobacterium mesophilicum SR1.6/6 TaxID=908290 RepID=A0A6B9FIX0_9HYPH|nr:DUF3768 domain-containing protein [Methylobacterium mesophilicum]QGY00848.1 DUF3768 domain-containing protein [Methylobacterium mesophilicum SR1.6/6]